MFQAYDLGTAYRLAAETESRPGPVDGLDAYGGQTVQGRRRDAGGCAYSPSCFNCPLPDCYRNTNGHTPSPQALGKTLGWPVELLETLRVATALHRRGAKSPVAPGGQRED